jgi:hypothetical protein
LILINAAAKGKSNIIISGRNSATPASTARQPLPSLIAYEGVYLISLVVFRNSARLAINESLPKIQALLAVGVLDSA